MCRRAGLATILAIAIVLLIRSSVAAEWYRGEQAIESEAALFDHMKYLLFIPRGDVEGGWPLILSLHGKGQEGADDGLLMLHGLPAIAARDPDFPFAVLAPQMPVGLPWDADQFAPVFTLDPALWGDPEDPLPAALRQALAESVSLRANSLVVTHPRLKSIYSPDEQGLKVYTVLQGASQLTVSALQWRVGEAVIDILDEVIATFDIDPRRIYLTGLSAGGFGAFHLAMVYPQRFAAIAPMAGGGDHELAQLLQDTPVWAFHGGADRINSPYYTQSMVAALEEIGADVRLSLYPEMGHNVWDRAYADPRLFAWFLSHTLAGGEGTPTPDRTPGPFALQQNYPNPFKPDTTIPFDLPAATRVELGLYNLAGQRVATLIDGVREAGSYHLRWDGRDDAGRMLASGMYLYRLAAGTRILTRKLLLLR